MDNPNYRIEGLIKEDGEQHDFEGPLSLILLLLQKNKIEIRDLQISDILDQYLAYLDMMQEMDLEIASEFIQMASHLLYIKTRMLLSSENEVSELEGLIASLEQLKAKDMLSRINVVVPQLKSMTEYGSLYFSKPQEPLPEGAGEYSFHHNSIDLLRAVYSVFSRRDKVLPQPEISGAIPQRIVYSVRDKSRQIVDLLKKGKASIRSIYASCESKSELIATFMSVLELCSMGSILIENSGDDYILEFTGGDIDNILEKIVE